MVIRKTCCRKKTFKSIYYMCAGVLKAIWSKYFVFIR